MTYVSCLIFDSELKNLVLLGKPGEKLNSIFTSGSSKQDILRELSRVLGLHQKQDDLNKVLQIKSDGGDVTFYSLVVDKWEPVVQEVSAASMHWYPVPFIMNYSASDRMLAGDGLTSYVVRVAHKKLRASRPE